MGEIFERTVPAHASDWTGERLTSAISGQIEIEHLHRYFLARELSRGCDVIDIACGQGYGSALLAQVARSVTGIDISEQAVQHAQESHQADNLRFILGDARSLEADDQSIDRIVSFDTIERFYDHDAFIKEVRRVLRPGGLLILSSPERDIYSPLGAPANPSHVRELTRLEFEQLLGAAFPHVEIFTQRPMIGSALVLDRVSSNGFLTFERRGPSHYESNAGLPRSPYLVAIASMEPLEALSNSLFIDTSEIGALIERAKATVTIEGQLREKTTDAARLEEEVLSYRRQIEDVQILLRQREASLDAKRDELDQLRSECDLLRLLADRGTQAGLAFDVDALVLAANAEAQQLRESHGRAQAAVESALADAWHWQEQHDQAQAAVQSALSDARHWQEQHEQAQAAVQSAMSEAQRWKGRYEQLNGHIEGLIRRVTPRIFRDAVRRRVLGEGDGG